jgi:hypothetical protein
MTQFLVDPTINPEWMTVISKSTRLQMNETEPVFELVRNCSECAECSNRPIARTTIHPNTEVIVSNFHMPHYPTLEHENVEVLGAVSKYRDERMLPLTLTEQELLNELAALPNRAQEGKL